QLAAPHERAPVVDADDGGPPGPPMDDADVRPERERAVGGRERLVVVALAAGGAPAVEGAGVTAGDGGVEGAGRRAQAARRDAFDALDLPVATRLGVHGGRRERQAGQAGDEE